MNTIILYDNTKIEMFKCFLLDNGEPIKIFPLIVNNLTRYSDEQYSSLDVKYTYYRLAWSFIKAGFTYKDGKWAQPEIPNLNIYPFSYICYYIKCGIKELK